MEEITSSNIEGKTFIGEVNLEETKDVNKDEADFSDLDSGDGTAPIYSIEFAIPPADWESAYA